jgi:hypothetical protein
MPRGTCENCGRHDVFVYATPLAFGRNVFVSARCISFPHGWDGDEDDDEGEPRRDNSARCAQQKAPTSLPGPSSSSS